MAIWKTRFFHFLIVILGTFNRTICDTEVLMNKPSNNVWGWSTFGNPASAQRIGQWTEAKEGSWVCSLGALQEPAVWLRTQDIDVKGAKRADIFVTYRIKPCSRNSSQQAEFKFCKEKIGLYVYHSNSSGIKLDPTNSQTKFEKLIDLPVTGDTKRETRITAIRPKGKFFYLAFLDQGACVAIYNVRVTYSYCTNRIINTLVQFPRTFAPFDNSEVTFIEGKCPVINSVNKTRLVGYCDSSGRWNVSSNVRCLCEPGFGYKRTSCQVCTEGTYKSVTNNTECLACPAHSASIHGNKVKCDCESNFYRAPGDSIAKPCRGLPLAPRQRNLTIVHNTSSITITWHHPLLHDGSIFYTVECAKCKSPKDKDCFNHYCGAALTFYPKKESMTWLNVTIGGLRTDTKYKFTVYSVNEITSSVPKSKWKFLEIFATTKKANDKSTVGGTGKKMTELRLILFIAVPVVTVIIILLMIGVCLMWKKSKRGYTMPPVEYDDNSGIVALPCKGQRLYIDPANYDSPEDALKNFAKELERNMLCLDKVIGGGEFGDVYSGTLTRPGEHSIPVAIKVLKSSCMYNKKNRDDFLAEASIMGQFCDPNVIFLEGVVTHGSPLMIVTEFMAKGSLDSYLKNMDGQLTILQLLDMARGVASGMKYLSEMNFIHRDLAARNVLVTENLVCKVADFGLSRELAEDSAYETKGGKIPVRWTAPEAINYKKFSAASDVWSFGILLWEIVSFGERPYWDWGNFEVINRVESGFRLPPPMKCPKSVHQLMLDCWTKDHTKRPRFAEIVKRLDLLITCPEKLEENTSIGRKAPKVDYRDISTVEEWLNGIKMTQYVEVFNRAGYQFIQDLLAIQEQDLLNMGVTLIGHRKKMYKSILEIKNITTNGVIVPRPRKSSEEV